MHADDGGIWPVRCGKEGVMDANLTNDPRYQAAKKHVEELKGFITHVTIYLAVNSFLFLLNFITDRGNWWFYWPLLGWGIAIVIHAAVFFGIEGRFGRDWEERKAREFMERDRLTQEG
jgi:hypothetical protein